MLAQDSIAIENPKFTPELVWSSADSQPPTVSLSSSKDMVISELSATPFVYASLQTKDVDMDKMTQSPRRQRHEHHVSSGERQSLISRQNQKFQSAIRRNFATATRDHGMEGGEHNEIDHAIASEIENNKSTSPCPVTAPHSDIMTEGADVGMQRQITPNVTTNENHDEDVLFEDDDEEDGYLFAGQMVNLLRISRLMKPKMPLLSTLTYLTCTTSMTTNMDCGIYTFRAHGMMYHNVRSFGREVGAEHKHLELYFYDDDPSLEHRYRKCRQEQFEKDKAVIKQLVEILKGNPYSEHLRSMGNVDNIEDYHIALNLDQTLNQKYINVPITSEVAAVWIEGVERRGQFSE
ncbi:hypothetical protein ZEAMMB73_Zm00001d036367 [Zea mays]|uniref:Uncharacterized protein n=1 Tax=Zea mays TaxID=4577 RepID=A0A1D6LMS2_MAIZE|nr:hypothetical protein ZEAMMB73_Zm00001d036367 [Zea mays]